MLIGEYGAWGLVLTGGNGIKTTGSPAADRDYSTGTIILPTKRTF
jgi:hypothetical protein